MDEIKVLFIGHGNDETRLGIPATGLREFDVHTVVTTYKEFDIEDVKKFDLVVTRNPTSDVAEIIRAIDTSGVTRWTDVDRPGCEFHEETAHRHYFVVPNPTVGEHYGAPYHVIPTGFNDRNPLWKPVERDPEKKVIGWFGVNEFEFRLCNREVEKFLNRNKDWSIVIGGNQRVYNSLTYLPENRKLFIPYCDYFVYPYSIEFMSIAIAPYPKEMPYTCMDEISVAEYAIKRIPYITSDLEIFEEIGGGLVSVSSSDWYDGLETFKKHVETGVEMTIFPDNDERERRSITEIGIWWNGALRYL